MKWSTDNHTAQATNEKIGISLVCLSCLFLEKNGEASRFFSDFRIDKTYIW